jgi:uncharacterized small protein (DUF1192 family)
VGYLPECPEWAIAEAAGDPLEPPQPTGIGTIHVWSPKPRSGEIASGGQPVHPAFRNPSTHGDHGHHSYPTLESELLDTLALFDVWTLVDRAHPQTDRIAALEAEISQKTPTLDRLVEDLTADVPKAVSRRIATLAAEIETLEGQLTDAKRSAQITEATENRDAFAEFRRMVDSLPTLPAGEERDQIRLRLAAEIRRIIVGAEASGGEILFRLDGDIELVIERSRLTELRIILDQETEDFFAFTRAEIFEVPGFDPNWKIRGVHQSV